MDMPMTGEEDMEPMPESPVAPESPVFNPPPPAPDISQTPRKIAGGGVPRTLEALALLGAGSPYVNKNQ